VKFHNGEAFNAESVKFTMDRILDPNGKSAWRARFPTVERVNAIDEFTVDIVSKVPNAALVNVMATIWMQPAKYFQQVGEVKFNQAPVGTGPFRFKEWRPDVFLTLEGNDVRQSLPAAGARTAVAGSSEGARARTSLTGINGDGQNPLGLGGERDRKGHRDIPDGYELLDERT
jgi:peptide/nickel transport system substrate-binding protein